MVALVAAIVLTVTFSGNALAVKPTTTPPTAATTF